MFVLLWSTTMLTLHAAFSHLAGYSRFGSVSGHTAAKTVHDYDNPHNSVVTAAQMQLGNHVGFWLLMGILFICIASGMGELLKQHQMKKPVGVKSVKPSLTCSSGSIRCKSSSQIPLAIQHTSRYRAYAQLHLEAVPASLSVHTFPHTVAVHGMSIATSQSSLPQSDSIASRIYTTDSALGSAKVSTRLWPPELENMAEVIVAHSRAAQALHGFPDLPHRAPPPVQDTSTQQAVDCPEGDCRQPAVSGKLAAGASSVVPNHEVSGRHLQQGSVSCLLHQNRSAWPEQASPQQAAALHACSAADPRARAVKAATAGPPAMQAERSLNNKSSRQKGWRKLYSVVTKQASRHRPNLEFLT